MRGFGLCLWQYSMAITELQLPLADVLHNWCGSYSVARQWKQQLEAPIFNKLNACLAPLALTVAAVGPMGVLTLPAIIPCLREWGDTLQPSTEMHCMAESLLP